MIWKDNLYFGREVTGYTTDAARSFFHDTIFGDTTSTQKTGLVGCIDRQFGLIDMGLSETRRKLDIKKIKTITLTPGMQTSVKLVKGPKHLKGEHFAASSSQGDSSTAITVKKGAEQFIFVAYGLMTHDSGATTATNINAVHRSSFDLNYEVIRKYKYRYTQQAGSVMQTDFSTWADATAITNNEVRPGVQMEETTIT